MLTPALPDVHRRAAAVLAAAGLSVLDTETDTGTDATGLRVRPAQDSPEHTLVAPVVNGLEELPPPLPQHNDRRAAWVRLMQAARNTLTAAGWERLWVTPTGGEFLPPDEGRGAGSAARRASCPTTCNRT
ncbi:hypothetical protein ABZ923_33790 [Streptomyces sp. NPDC046881]|uniref:hypothetical protein n=1 Tax=Streptomyces sp. NPDC046881 TaxID=3155374 RepID=UPI0033E0A594